MKLDGFFAAIAPFLEGRETHSQAVRALYGEGDDGRVHDWDPNHLPPDARRLALYGRFCRGHRLDALGSTFSETRAALVEAQGEAAWEALVADYFRAHPMRHAELNENGSELPAFLAREAGARGLPAYIAELADLEWWSFRTRVAPDDPRDESPDAGPLRLAATVELRPYAHDLCAWLELPQGEHGGQGGEARESLPEARACVVLFWRDRELDSRFAEAEPLELAILHALFEGRPLASAAERAGADPAQLEETLADLHGAGILLGKPAALST